MSLRRRALIWALAAAALGVLAYLLGVGSLLGQRAEESVLEASAFTDDPPAPLSLVSPLAVVISVAAIAMVALWVHGIGRTVTVVLSASVSILASQLLKERWLERPDLLEFDAQNTFPSGHMTVFTAVAAALLWALPPRWRMIMSVPTVVLLGVVAWQLLEYGWHRPSDLIGAQALVVLVFAIAAWVGPHRSRAAHSKPTAATVNRIVGLGLTILGLVILLGGLLLVAFAAATRSDELMLNAGEISLVGVSVLVTRILAKLCP